MLQQLHKALNMSDTCAAKLIMQNHCMSGVE